ncbi:hypothetical protein GH876_26475 [Bacillus thuringiensis]|nr:hypothetical protein [Bacillus cereus]MRB05485.1 hypothetical protein [Bacillus thuringiensis]
MKSVESYRNPIGYESHSEVGGVIYKPEVYKLSMVSMHNEPIEYGMCGRISDGTGL